MPTPCLLRYSQHSPSWKQLACTRSRRFVWYGHEAIKSCRPRPSWRLESLKKVPQSIQILLMPVSTTNHCVRIRERLEANPVKAVALHAIASAWSLVCLVVVSLFRFVHTWTNLQMMAGRSFKMATPSFLKTLFLCGLNDPTYVSGGTDYSSSSLSRGGRVMQGLGSGGKGSGGKGSGGKESGGKVSGGKGSGGKGSGGKGSGGKGSGGKGSGGKGSGGKGSGGKGSGGKGSGGKGSGGKGSVVEGEWWEGECCG
ncbi:hypothetical protein EMCRGX_G008273 [Ephydatia muelleri]